jgi:hypothetical protein
VGARAYLGARPGGRRRDGRWVEPRGTTPAARSMLERRPGAGVAIADGAGRKVGCHLGLVGLAEAIAAGAGDCGSGDGVERLGTELAQRVEAAPRELAGDRDRGARVGEPAGLERELVGAVGARRPAGCLGRLIERPAQLRRVLPGELAGPGALVGAVHADVEPGAAHRLARGRRARHVAELAEDRRGGQLADAAWRISARQPVWRRASWRSACSIGAS